MVDLTSQGFLSVKNMSSIRSRILSPPIIFHDFFCMQQSLLLTPSWYKVSSIPTNIVEHLGLHSLEKAVTGERSAATKSTFRTYAVSQICSHMYYSSDPGHDPSSPNNLSKATSGLCIRQWPLRNSASGLGLCGEGGTPNIRVARFCDGGLFS